MAITTNEAWAEGARAIVVGCGGVGGCVLASLTRAGRHVVGVSNNAEITQAVGAGGLRARLLDGEHTARIDLVTRAETLPPGPYDLALLAVPPNRLEEAAAGVLPALGEHGMLVPLANGLPEERLAARFGPSRVVGGIVGFGASMLAPGLVEQTSDGGITVGRLDGRVDETSARIAAFLTPVGPIEVTSNLRGARWSKLAINCAISSLGTIGGDRLGALMRHRFVRRLCLEVMTEVTQVALALGVRLEKISGTLDLEWLALDDEERVVPGSPGLLAKHTVLLAVGAKYRRLRSSMLLAIERGREPPVEFLNGEVVSRADVLGLPVPINAAVVEAVQAIGRKERAASLEGLRRLFDETRPILRGMKLAA
jgi:2-dehydropantoate 2-reductase